ncbi:glucosidase 2 subunit beta-like isoform X2 [Rutidosis leptorrhynchoides]|uniref:glucosidase 2 subunit beta-like isoform X2 n=1 Tax=Rutidosis leptorrhynchoides TaxID=125765 RepID=UPI003A98F97B
MKINTSILILISTLVLRSIASNNLLGIAPQDEKYYKGLWSSGMIKCKDGSKTFTKSQFNDDFCDCFDGSDEPGTSACPTGKFYCQNAGHSPVTIFSSRINDGICDCCDGSDEYGGQIRCKNTCWEAGKVARDMLMKKIATYQEGVAIRKREIEQAKISVANDEAELSKLKNEEKILKGIVQPLKEHKERIEKAVEKERVQKEIVEKQKKEAEESESKQLKVEEKVDGVEQPPANNNDDKSAILDNFPSDQHDVKEEEASKIENKGEVADKDIYSLSREDLGREIGSRWTGKKPEQQYHAVDDVKNDHEASNNVHDEENNGYDTETDDDHQHYDDDTDEHMDDVGDEANDEFDSSNTYEPDEEVDMSEAENIQKEYDEASTKLSKLQSKITRLTKKLGNDFGPEKEFYSLYGQCFESKQNKYVYKVCAFKQATQEEGYSTTRLGNWKKFDDSYNVMLFSNGDNCWNGPDRSLKVSLRCGLKVELADVDEPSRCEYAATLTTPALCLEGKLKELEAELEVLNSQLPEFHDEL